MTLVMEGNPIIRIRDLVDYPAIKKLASALHRVDTSRHGAAIMIGAGFSRSAARHVDGQKKFPCGKSSPRAWHASCVPTKRI